LTIAILLKRDVVSGAWGATDTPNRTQALERLTPLKRIEAIEYRVEILRIKSGASFNSRR
jgi:hypothetical protein